MVDHDEPDRARAYIVRIPHKNAAQVETSEEEFLEHPSIIIDTGGEQSADLVTNSADMIAWKKSEPRWEDITSDMQMPHYHVVEFGNRLPSRMCKAVALMQQQPRCYPYNDGRNCAGEIPEDLPALVPMDPMEDIPNPKGVFQPEQRGTMPFAVQSDDIVYLYRPADEHCLLRDGNLYPLTTLLRGPLALPSKECLETFAFGGFNRTEENHERIWEAFSNDPRLSNLRTEVTMRMVNGEYDHEYTGERTIPLCNLTMSSLPPCTVYGTQQEYDEYESGSLSAMDNGWNVYIAQQCQRNHGIRMANYAAQIGDRTAHLVNMYADPTYWYSHYCTELRINSLFNHEIRLIKEMTKGTMSMHICMSKISTHHRNFEAKSGLGTLLPRYHPPRE
jgi:hypothetical protein